MHINSYRDPIHVEAHTVFLGSHAPGTEQLQFIAWFALPA
jgi:hypothetical protein